MNAVRSYLNRSPDERKTVLLTVAAVPIVKASLSWRGYAATTRLLNRFGRTGSTTADGKRARARLAQRVMTRLPAHLTCLERSLVVWWLSGGEPGAAIRFGVQPGEADGTPRFHAWVEVDGQVLKDGVEDISEYLPLTEPDSVQLGRFD